MGTPFKMKGFSGFTSNSPLKDHEYDADGNLIPSSKHQKTSKRKFKKKTVVVDSKTYDKPKKTDVVKPTIDYSKLTDAELEALRTK